MIERQDFRELLATLMIEYRAFGKLGDETLRKCDRALNQTATDDFSASVRRDELLIALRKVRAHTSYVNPTNDLLRGLLQSIERIADAALSGGA